MGGFAANRGVFFSYDEYEGRQVRTRFIWHVDDRDACRWGQALSIDGGVAWETNWYMDFRRSGA